METRVRITAQSRAGISNPKVRSWSPSPENWEKIKAERSEEVGGKGESGSWGVATAGQEEPGGGEGRRREEGAKGCNPLELSQRRPSPGSSGLWPPTPQSDPSRANTKGP